MFHRHARQLSALACCLKTVLSTANKGAPPKRRGEGRIQMAHWTRGSLHGLLEEATEETGERGRSVSAIPVRLDKKTPGTHGDHFKHAFRLDEFVTLIQAYPA